MRITIRRAGKDLAIDGDITSSGSNADGTVDMQVTGEDGQPWAEIVMDVEDALDIGSLGFNGLADMLRAKRADPPFPRRTAR